MPGSVPGAEPGPEPEPGAGPMPESGTSVAWAGTEAGVAVTPFPSIVTSPVWAGASTGHVMVWVFCSHTPQVTTVLMKLGGMAGWVQTAGSPVQISLMV